MSAVDSNLATHAAKAVVPLFIFGIAVMLLGVALQIAQNSGMVGSISVLGQVTIFGLLSKIGGVAMILGLLFAALRLSGGEGPEALMEQELPMSARPGPVTDLTRPIRPARLRSDAVSARPE